MYFKILKIIIYFVIKYSLLQIKKRVTKKNIIIIESFSPNRYGGNPKYLFEYFSYNSNYKTYWITENNEIIKYLESKNLNYISSKNILHKIYVSFYAKIIISSGTDYYNILNLIKENNTVVKICTMHGSGPKLSI